MSERQIPGSVFVNETSTAQRQIPGGVYVNEVSGSPVALTASSGSFALTGNDVALVLSTQRTLTAGTGPFIMASVIITGLIHGRKITASSGSFDFQGAPSTSDFQVTAETNAYSLSGSAGVLANHVLVSNVGSFSLTGNQAALTKTGGGLSFIAEEGAFALSGPTTNLARNTFILTADTGSFAVTGYTIPGKIDFVASTGDFVLTGYTSSQTLNRFWIRKPPPNSNAIWNRI